jgi:DNA polymerase-4
VTLKVNYHDFEIVSRRETFAGAVAGEAQLLATAAALLLRLKPARGVRLLGITLSGLTSRDQAGFPAQRMSLFS